MNNITGNIKKQSSTYTVELTVPKGELIYRFHQYWNQVKDKLSPELIKMAKKGGYRELKQERVVKAAGGSAKFYRPILIEVINNWFNQQDRQALMINDIDLHEGLEQYQLSAIAYLEPEVTWKKPIPGISESFVVKMPKQPIGIIDRMVEAEINIARENAVVLIPVPEETVACEGQVVLLTANSVLNNQTWAPGSFVNNKWLLKRELFHIPEMMNALLGMKAGEDKKIQVILNNRFTEDVRGQTVEISLKINQIYTRELPNIDDDLAKTYGYNDLTAYKLALTAKATKDTTEDRQKLLYLSITSQLMNPETVEIEPIPFQWMTTKAKEIYAQSREMVRTEEELISHFAGQNLIAGTPVTDKPTLLTFFAEKAAQQLVHDLILRSWGKKKGILGDSTLEMLPEYVAEVKKYLLESTQIEEYEVEKEAS